MEPGLRILSGGELEILTTQSEHSGLYGCHLTWQDGTMWSSQEMLLTVRQRTVVTRHSANISVLEQSGSLTLHCSFTYDFSLHSSLETWWTVERGGLLAVLHTEGDERRHSTDLRGRAVYLSYPYRQISTIYLSLSLDNVRLEDDGNYTCHAR